LHSNDANECSIGVFMDTSYHSKIIISSEYTDSINLSKSCLTRELHSSWSMPMVTHLGSLPIINSSDLLCNLRSE
jgi:hypothetical protein